MITPDELAGRRCYWLLDLAWAGLTLRLSTHELDIEEAGTGEIHHYHAALDELRLSEAIGELGEEEAPQTLPVEAILPVDVPAMIARGHDLTTARASLSRWVEGTDYGVRRALLVGAVRDPEWGEAWEPVAFSVEELPWQDRTLLPPPLARVDGTTWPQEILSLAEQHLGLAYPIVVGHPGRVDAQVNASGRVAGTIGCWAMHDPNNTGTGGNYHGVVLVVAGHHVSARRVYLIADGMASAVRCFVFNGFDARGQPVAYVPWYSERSSTDEPYDYDGGGIYAFGTADFDSGVTYGLGENPVCNDFRHSSQPKTWVTWHDEEDDSRGGWQQAGRTMRGAGEILAWLIGLSTMAVDSGRWAAAYPLLKRFQLDFAIDATCTPWDFIREHLLPILPISLRHGPEGLYPVVWRFDAQEQDAALHIDVDTNPEIQRVGRVRSDASEIRNDFSLSYAYSRKSQTYLGTVRLGAHAIEGSETESPILPDPRCRRSQARYPVASHASESRVIYETATARAVVAWWAAAYTAPRRTVAYTVPETLGCLLEPGAVVIVTDSAVHLDRQLCLVVDVQIDSTERVGLSLRLLDSAVQIRS